MGIAIRVEIIIRFRLNQSHMKQRIWKRHYNLKTIVSVLSWVKILRTIQQYFLVWIELEMKLRCHHNWKTTNHVNAKLKNSIFCNWWHMNLRTEIDNNIQISIPRVEKVYSLLQAFIHFLLKIYHKISNYIIKRPKKIRHFGAYFSI